MKCLQFSIPPLPTLITVGHAFWKPGMQHVQRSFNVFDMIFVRKGALYMTEENKEYEIKENCMLVVESGKLHWGHESCKEETEIFWVHFKHTNPLHVERDDISWSYIYPNGTDADLEPLKQYMYIPKFAQLDLRLVFPILERMISVHRHFTQGNAIEIHSLLADLFVQLQSLLQLKDSSRSKTLAESITSYLYRRFNEPFDSKKLEKEFHFHYDYLSRCLKKHTGMTPVQYLHHIQLGEAKLLLEHTALSIQDISEAVGQSNYNYFVRLFTKKVGISPSKYRSISRRSYLK
ncbi:AraC family transcriptional regulator [Gracilibacillus sp. YIM 98692]|uniref:helix-turn-helix transcriptional regulator n=1 Tax=Gracilibacillus sp. YIM 98692 TaxID=2663532 RepID=UPI0013D02E03|nr:AraC family transcriptional regulator [Gracilibacillus sp. YIM 98692]